MLHRVLTIDFHTLVVSTMDRTTKPLVWRNHRSRNPSKSGGVDEYVPGAGQQYMFLGLGRSTCSWGWADARVCSTSTVLCMATSWGGEGPRWDLGFGKYTGPCCIHWIALILLSLCLLTCAMLPFVYQSAYGLRVLGSREVGRCYGQMQLCRRAVNSPIESRTLIFPISSTVNCCQGHIGEQLALCVKTQQKVRWKDTNSSDS